MAAVTVLGAAASVWGANGGSEQVNPGEEAFAWSGIGTGIWIMAGSWLPENDPMGKEREGAVQEMALGLGIRPCAPTNPATERPPRASARLLLVFKSSWAPLTISSACVCHPLCFNQ